MTIQLHWMELIWMMPIACVCFVRWMWPMDGKNRLEMQQNISVYFVCEQMNMPCLLCWRRSIIMLNWIDAQRDSMCIVSTCVNHTFSHLAADKIIAHTSHSFYRGLTVYDKADKKCYVALQPSFQIVDDRARKRVGERLNLPNSF